MTVGEPNGASINNIGILWDLDGVLVDSGAAHYQAWSKTCARYSIPFSPEAFQRTFGMNNAGIVATLIGHVIASEQRLRDQSLQRGTLSADHPRACTNLSRCETLVRPFSGSKAPTGSGLLSTVGQYRCHGGRAGRAFLFHGRGFWCRNALASPTRRCSSKPLAVSAFLRRTAWSSRTRLPASRRHSAAA